jgi:RimJ/RimL family protein N-acetyltransferase
MTVTSPFSFAPVREEQRDLLSNWLTQEHIQKWLHGEGLRNTLNDLENSFKGSSFYRHWIAYYKDIPFGYLITSEIAKENGDELAQWCQEAGRAITLDLFICDPQFLGKGLAVPMIQDFLISHFSDAAEVLIDPEAANTRAIHVYEKAGFRMIGEFIASRHPVRHYKMRLSMKELLQNHSKSIA